MQDEQRFQALQRKRYEARLQLNGTTEELYRVIRQAVKSGAPVANVARDAGMSRQAVYNIVKQEGTK